MSLPVPRLKSPDWKRTGKQGEAPAVFLTAHRLNLRFIVLSGRRYLNPVFLITPVRYEACSGIRSQFFCRCQTFLVSVVRHCQVLQVPYLMRIGAVQISFSILFPGMQ